MKISVFYDHLVTAAKQTGLALSGVCAQAAAAGISEVDIDAAAYLGREDEISDMLDAAGMSVGGIYGFFDMGHDTDSVNAQKTDEFLAEAERSGASSALVIPGYLEGDERVAGSAEYNGCVALMKRRVAQLCEDARGTGVGICMENFGFPNAPYATAEELISFLRDIPGLLYNLDTGNFMYSEHDTITEYEKLKPYISHVHCKDHTLTPHPDEKPEFTSAGRAMYSVPVGYGCIPVKQIVTELLLGGYRGSFSIEQFGAPDQLGYMRKAASWLLETERAVLGNR